MSGTESAEEAFVAALEKYITEADEPGSFKGMLYGDAGTGKTYIGMGLAQNITPKNKTICYLDSGQGWFLIDERLKARAFRMSLPGIEPIPQVVKAIQLGVGRFKDVGTIVVDEFSSFERMDLLNLTAARAKGNPNKDPNEPKLPDMAASGNRMLKVTGALVTLNNVNVILLSHERRDQSDSGSLISVGPLLTPKLSSRVEGLLQLTGRVIADDDIDKPTGKIIYNRTIQVHPKGVYSAKTKIAGMDKLYLTPKEFVKIISDSLRNGEKVEQPVEVKEESTITTEIDKLTAALEEIGQ